MRTKPILLIVVSAFAVLTATTGRPAAAQHLPSGIAASAPVESRDPTLVGQALTSEGTDGYFLDHVADTITVGAPATNHGQNTRIVFFRAADAPAVDEQSCATWSRQTNGIDQQGVALRVRPTDGGGTSAITVTKNVWLGANWIFNVHVWDPAANPAFALIGQFDLSVGFRNGNAAVDLPWRICARVVGDVVSFSVWPTTRARPSWVDPSHGGSVALPPGYDQPGVAGGYIGHLRPGDSASFTAFDTKAFDAMRLWAPWNVSVRQPTAVQALS